MFQDFYLTVWTLMITIVTPRELRMQKKRYAANVYLFLFCFRSFIWLRGPDYSYSTYMYRAQSSEGMIMSHQYLSFCLFQEFYQTVWTLMTTVMTAMEQGTAVEDRSSIVHTRWSNGSTSSRKHGQDCWMKTANLCEYWKPRQIIMYCSCQNTFTVFFGPCWPTSHYWTYS